MLARISEKLAIKGLSIENIRTELRQRTGVNEQQNRREFVVHVNCTTSSLDHKEQLSQLLADLNHVKEELALDVMDVRVQHARPPPPE